MYHRFRDWLTLNRILKGNVDLEREKSIINHEKQLTNFTKNTDNPFTH